MSQAAMEHWERIELLFHSAREMSADRRDGYLRTQANGDDALVAEVRSLLTALDIDSGQLESPVHLVPAVPQKTTTLDRLSLGTSLGAYRVLDCIGSGGMGEVYLAERADGLFQKQVAVKVLRPDAAEHFQRFSSERQILARLEHPGIARLLDGGMTPDGRPYMIMEFVAGESITDYCLARRLSLEKRLSLFHQCAEAVVFAHAQGVVHRDLKPGNILVTAEGQVKLLDFGVAKFLNPGDKPATTHTEAPLTLSYAAPEQAQGKSASTATDVHALGVILYELLTGTTPWSSASASMAVILQSVLNQIPKPASQTARERDNPPVPPGLLHGDLDAMIARCLRKNPTERYTSVGDLLADLSRYSVGEPISAGIATTGGSRLPRRDQAERRQLSVLFCDLVGSTALSEELDPEIYRELLLSYQQTSAEVIARYEGYIAQRLGDGLLVYFGYPSAHDDDAERAVRCGYDLVAAISRLDRSPKLAVRIGLHTGTVVVGQMGGTETLATGATTNLASRLQGLADPDTVLMSDATLRLVPGLFITRDLGTPELKGLNKPVRVHQVIQPSGVRSRLEASGKLTPFVGREQERALLLDRWNDVGEGRGQAVLLSAEPGMGKSRLLMMLRGRIQDSPHTWLECRASPLMRNSAYQPVIELLHRGLALREGDTSEQKFQRLEQSLDAIGLNKAETIPLIAPILNLVLPERYPASQLGPELKRKRTLEALSAWVVALSRQQPLVIAFEDLHWIDASSLDLLGILMEQIATAPVLLVMTARPEFVSPWPARSHLALMSLHPIRMAQAGQIVSSLAGHRPLPPAVHKTVLERAGGVPLFVEELIKSLLESGQIVERDGVWEVRGNPDQLDIPDTLQASLMARLDRLGPARDLIQTAAVVGREIPYHLLQLVADLDEPELRRQLKQLVDAELLYLRGTPPNATYLFKHALIQDTAYESLLKSTRQNLHGVIAQALETNFPERVASEPEVFAAHCEKAALILPAVRYYKLAADKAAAAVSLQEAIAHSEHGLSLLTMQPQSDERIQLELDLCLTEGNCRMAVLGFGHSTVETVFARASALCDKTTNPALLGRAFGSLFILYYNRPEFAQACALGERLAQLGQTTKVDSMQMLGLSETGWAKMNMGFLSEARDFSQRGLDLVTPELVAAVLNMIGFNAYVGTAIPIAYVQWLQGYPDQALKTAHWVLEKAKDSKHPQGMAWALCQATGLMPLWRREPQQALEPTRSAIELSERLGYMEWLGFAEQHLGLALCMLGSLDEGLAMLHRANQAKRERRSMAHYSMHAVLEAEQCRRFGRLHEARIALDSAFACMEEHDERYWETELHRVKGELLLAEPNGNEKAAESCFQKALEVSRSQQAKSLELRAATSLARLWQRQGRKSGAREVLKPVYDWFTEGFDTPDLMDAKCLLNSLEGA